jgi:glycosyltransferase involved in cell wall biosynthesis
MKVLHIINDVERGGAESMLLRLSTALSRTANVTNAVISLTGPGAHSPALIEAGVNVRYANMTGLKSFPLAFIRLVGFILAEKPDVIHTWMYHSNLVGGVAARIAKPLTPVCWSIRQAYLAPENSKRSTLIVSKISAKLSRVIPTRIIYQGEVCRHSHECVGYRASKAYIIPNGVDASVFRPDPLSRIRMRKSLDLSPHTKVIGLVARFHPDKDVPTFARAAGIVAKELPDTRFVLCGEAMDGSNAELMSLLRRNDIVEQTCLLGERSDVPEVMSCLDVATLSSITEGFPNAILEAMACGVPCVATNVGETADLIGNTGIIVEPRHPEELAAGWKTLLLMPESERSTLGKAASIRVQDRFTMELDDGCSVKWKARSCELLGNESRP